MIRLFHVYFPSRTLILVVSEALLIITALLAAMLLRFGGDFELVLLYQAGGFKIAIAAGVLMLCMYYYDLYDSLVLHRISEVLTKLVQVLGMASVILSVVYYIYPDVQLGRGPFLIWILLAGISLALWRRLFTVINRSSRLGDRTVLIGAGSMAATLCSEIESRPELGLNLVGYVETQSVNGHRVNGLRYLGPIETLPSLMEKERVSRVILALPDQRGRLPVKMLLGLKGQGLLVQNGPDIYEAVTGRVDIDSLRPSWLLFSDGFRLSRVMLLYKRIASIVLSSVGILITGPVMALIALAVRLDSPGPAIFRQKRVGKGGSIFTIYKFRSMRCDADPDGVARPAMERDDRVTRVGRWLRRLRLDELPQLFNILRGDMYFIGPRPFTPNMEKDLAERIPFYSERWIVKPGATGWAQIRRGYCSSLKDNVEKLSYDLFYIKNLSTGLDCLILFETVKILVLGRGGR